MTDLDFDFLAQYEAHYKRAIESSYCRYIPLPDLKRMADIYRSIYASVRFNMACAKCKLQLLKDVGELYYTEKERREQLKKKKYGETRKRKEQTESKAEGDVLGVGEGATA